MKLSRTEIVGPRYRFTGGNANPRVEYGYKGEPHGLRLRFSRTNTQRGREHLITVLGEAERDVGHFKSVVSGENGYLLDIELNKKYRDRGLSWVLINMALYDLVLINKVRLDTLYVQRVVGRSNASFGALVGILQFGFTDLTEKTIQRFFEQAAGNREKGILQSMRGRKGKPVPVLKMAGRRVMFFPELPQGTIRALAGDLSGLRALFQQRLAFLDNADYFLSSAAQDIMPDYVRLLPPNPEVVSC